MKIGIISDIHANWEALEAADKILFDVQQVWCLGDIVGYGADPRLCLEYIRQRCQIKLKGNHDQAVADLRNIDFFNPVAKQAVLWTRNQLSADDCRFLAQLPSSLSVTTEDRSLPVVWLVHGSLRSPLEEYILDAATAQATQTLLAQQAQEVHFPKDAPVLLFFGHSHLAEVYIFNDKGKKLQHLSVTTEQRLTLEGGWYYLVNVGSVGQPRDGVPLGSCAILDTDQWTIQIIRFGYPIAVAAQKILQAGLPAELAYRLFYGW
ncbi:MAG: metallophosphatase family protein [Armatimonadetes bacterium]|nr:metallophosphatase family protein [Armatimonadota bacterium]MDW8122176.1 metallophosphoesterase family protein [Armatimonadota bacterium]